MFEMSHIVIHEGMGFKMNFWILYYFCLSLHYLRLFLKDEAKYNIKSHFFSCIYGSKSLWPLTRITHLFFHYCVNELILVRVMVYPRMYGRDTP